MAAIVKSVLESGNETIVVDVECHISNGLPAIVVVGFANKAVEESKERIRGAFATAKLELPRKRITINLAPADVPKNTTSFDLPIAVSIMLAANQVARKIPKGTSFIGELGLDGSVRGVRGIIGKLLAARREGFTTFYIPSDNLSQARLVPGLTLIPVHKINDLYLDLTDTLPLKHHISGEDVFELSIEEPMNDFKEVVGQSRAKRALEIAAAGSHNILLNGAPGTGKSMLAKAITSILPPMELEEVLEVTHLHSLASKSYEKIVARRPFRAPHHSASSISILGGGQHPRPGEISLAHHGVLFFDEFPEFNRSVIEALRQPLEDRVISVSRARDTVVFPANFMLVATSNPCPCGYYGTKKLCICLPHQINNYRRKLSGPIVDRIDLYVDVNEVNHSRLLHSDHEESSDEIQKRVLRARARQLERFQGPLKHNATIDTKDMKRLIKLAPSAESLLNQAAERLSLSARSYMRTLKVAQTIADLADADLVDASHVSEALQYRRQTEILI